MKKFGKYTAALWLLLLLVGCKDYRGLNELSIVAGITLDLSEDDPTEFQMGFEIVDTAAGKDQRGKKTIFLEAKGPTVYDAIASGNEQLAKDMYFGNADLLVIQEKAARAVGLSDIIEPFIRGYSVRDTLLVCVSREETAKAILEPSPDLDKVISYDVSGALNWQKSGANSIRSLEAFEIYDDLKRDTGSTALPALSSQKDKDVPEPQLDGLALFQRDTLVGFLNDELVPYYMYLVEPLQRGSFSFWLDGDPAKRISLQIHSSKPTLSFEKKEGYLLYTADLKVQASISGIAPAAGNLEEALILEIQRQAAADLEKRIEETVELLQDTMQTDIFGFGKSVYHKDPKFWDTIKDTRVEVFQDAEVDVRATVEIDRTGYLTQ